MDNQKNAQIDKQGWFYGWNILLLTMVFQAVSYGLITYGFALLVVPWQQEFGAAVRDIMLGIAILQFSAGVQSAFVGRALDNYSPRLIVMVGAGLLAIGFGLMAMATALWQIIVLYATLIPAAIAMTGPLVAQSLILRWFVGRRGVAMGISALGTSIGGLIFPSLLGLMLASSGWRISLLVIPSLGALVVCLLTYIVLNKRLPPKIIQKPQSGDDSHCGTIFTTDNRQWKTKEIFSSKSFWILVVAFIPVIASYSAVQFNFGPYIKNLGYAPEQTAVLISIVAFLMLLGKLLFGHLADFVDVRLLYVLAVGAMCMVLVLLQGAPDLWLIRVCAGFLGVAIGGYIPLSGLIIGALFGVASFGRVMGLFTMFITLGAFGSILAGWIYDQTGNYDAVFRVFLAILLLPASSILFLKLPAKNQYQKFNI